jgi:hypothetical protein
MIQIRGWRFQSICFSAYYPHNQFNWEIYPDIWNGTNHWVGLISAQFIPTSGCDGWNRRLVVTTSSVTRYIDYYHMSTIHFVQPVEIRILNANGVGIHPDFYVPTVPAPPPTKYACLNGQCALDQRGVFNTLAECQAVCRPLNGQPCNCPPPSICLSYQEAKAIRDTLLQTKQILE